jgi:hypothetical protein
LELGGPGNSELPARDVRLRPNPLRSGSPAGIDAPSDAQLAPESATLDSAAAPSEPSAQLDVPLPAEEENQPAPAADAPLPPRLERLSLQLRQCLAFYYDRPLNTRDDSAWSVMHSFLGYGVNAPLAVGAPNGRRVNAISWMCGNNPCAGRTLLYLHNGRIVGREGPGFQGHAGQFLAMLAQTRVAADYPLKIEGRDFQIADLVESEKLGCRDRTELTFRLIGLSHYLPPDATWKNDLGQGWSIERLVANEITQPVNGAACGGTHRLMGLSYSLAKRRKAELPMEGWWARAEKYERDYHRYTWTLQNRDGSFSSDWFRQRTDWGGVDRKLQTSGHILEWMVFSLPEEELLEERTLRAVEFLNNLMIQHRYQRWEVGPRGHAIRALRLYHERVFEGMLATPEQRLAVLAEDRQR